MDRSEDEVVEAIARVLASDDPQVVVGLGDDAAVVRPGAGQQVLTTDLLAEGIHFERGAISAHDLGAKAIIVNVSDLAAMGASPRYAVVSIAVPPDVEMAWVIELFGGMRDASAEYALRIVGGDTNRAEIVVLSVTVVGEVAPGRAVTRSGATVGDRIVITGSLGAAAGGLVLSRLPSAAASTALSKPWGRELSRALARPTARVGEGQVLSRAGARAMMDLSDGLARDLARLCLASGVGARVRTAEVPIAPALADGAETLGVDPLELALSGGEDYELLATMSSEDAASARAEIQDVFGVTLTEIGEIVEGSGVEAVDASGASSPLEPAGWDHFVGE